MADHWYFIVTPDPTQYPDGITDAAGVQKFFIKFGDGLHGSRYDTHNPCFDIAGNNNIPGSGTVGVPGSDDPGVRIGKFVETHLLAANGLGLTQVGTSEWYIILPGVGGIGALRTWLANFLAAFPDSNFDGDGNSTSDQVTWNWIQLNLVAMTLAGFH